TLSVHITQVYSLIEMYLIYGSHLVLANEILLKFILRHSFTVNFSHNVRHTFHVRFRHFLLAFSAALGRLAAFFTAARSRLFLGLLLIFCVSRIFTRIISTAAGTEYQHRRGD